MKISLLKAMINDLSEEHAFLKKNLLDFFENRVSSVGITHKLDRDYVAEMKASGIYESILSGYKKEIALKLGLIILEEFVEIAYAETEYDFTTQFNVYCIKRETTK